MIRPEHAQEILDDLRRAPKKGQWAVVPAVRVEGEWHPAGTRPDEWYDTREEAETAARRPDRPAWVAEVICVQGGWSLGEHIEV